MDFTELNEMIPYAKGGKEKILRMSPYKNITLALPGRHWDQTTPKGGDFVVMINDPVYKNKEHQFTHTDIFKDVELKSESEHFGFFMNQYLSVITGESNPDKIELGDGLSMPGIEFKNFLHAAQCLAVAEHRRYAQYEAKFGGRYLPFRFAAGIAQGLWGAADAANLQKRGRPGVEMLERLNGVPELTKELMGEKKA